MISALRQWWSQLINPIHHEPDMLYSELDDDQEFFIANLIEEATGDADCPSREAVIAFVRDMAQDSIDWHDNHINALIDKMLKDGRLVSDGSCLVSVEWRPNIAAKIKEGRAGIYNRLNEPVSNCEVSHSKAKHNYLICSEGKCSIDHCPIPNIIHD